MSWSHDVVLRARTCASVLPVRVAIVRVPMANNPFKAGDAVFYSSQNDGDVPCKVVSIHGDQKVRIDIREGAIKVDKLKKRTSAEMGEKRNSPVSDGKENPKDKRQRTEASDNKDGKLASGGAYEIGQKRNSPEDGKLASGGADETGQKRNSPVRDDSQNPKGKNSTARPLTTKTESWPVAAAQAETKTEVWPAAAQAEAQTQGRPVAAMMKVTADQE